MTATLGRIGKWLRRDLRAALSLGFLLVLFALSVAAPVLAPHSPTDQDVNNTLQEPDAAHPLGTDDLGRDVLSRLIYGAPATLYASFLAVAVAILLGVPVGLLAGFLGGWIDDGISRLIDTLLSFPAIVLAIAVTGALGVGLTNGMIAVGIVFSPQLARLVRAQTLIVKRELYVDAARVFGASLGRILWKHVVPNAIQPVIVQVTLAARGGAAGRSQPELPGAGRAAAAALVGRHAGPRLPLHGDRAGADVCPGLAILLTALAFNALGESLRVALDPTMKLR